MGNQRNLVRALGLGYVIIFVIANIIGSGVYKKVAPMAAELQSSIWIAVAWIVGGIITLFGALSNAEVAGLRPVVRPTPETHALRRVGRNRVEGELDIAHRHGCDRSARWRRRR